MMYRCACDDVTTGLMTFGGNLSDLSGAPIDHAIETAPINRAANARLCLTFKDAVLTATSIASALDPIAGTSNLWLPHQDGVLSKIATRFALAAERNANPDNKERV
jgi:hypothetical protein